jgi:hypothetical protein
MNLDHNPYPSDEYEKTVLQLRKDKIYQKLFFYDNLPEDKEIIAYIHEWRFINKRLQEIERKYSI